MMMTKSVAIIPARGSSKRLPQKNILPIRGKPMVVLAIECAIKSDLFDKVIVSTDDEEVSSIVAESGAELHRRTPCLSTDGTTVVDVCLDVIASEASKGEDYEQFCCLYATAPFRTPTDIHNVVNLLDRDTCNFAMSLLPIETMGNLYTFRDGSRVIDPMLSEHELSSNNVDTSDWIYVDAGNIYACWVEKFIKYKTFTGPKLKGYALPGYCHIDINTIDDYELTVILADHFKI